MLRILGVVEHAPEWTPDEGDRARWAAGATAHLGDHALFHHPDLTALAISLDPAAGRLHLLEWKPPGSGTPLPLALVESTSQFGGVPVPVLTFPGHRMFLYSPHSLVPGLLAELIALEPPGAGHRLGFYPHLPIPATLAAARLAPDSGAEIGAEDVCPRVRIREAWGGSWEKYWSERPDGLRREVPRVRRRIEESGGLRIVSRARLDADGESALGHAMDLHAARWGKRVHGVSDLALAENRRRLFSLARHFEAVGSLRLDWLEREGRPAALVLGAVRGGTHFFYWAAFDPAAARLSPGNVLYAALLEEAFARGLALADFMFGDEAYKKRWADEAAPLSVIVRPGAGFIGKASFHALRFARKLKRSIFS